MRVMMLLPLCEKTTALVVKTSAARSADNGRSRRNSFLVEDLDPLSTN
jgi:hypothetical protein